MLAVEKSDIVHALSGTTMKEKTEFFNLYNHDFIRVAVGIPEVRVADPAFNETRTIELMEKAICPSQRQCRDSGQTASRLVGDQAVAVLVLSDGYVVYRRSGSSNSHIKPFCL